MESNRKRSPTCLMGKNPSQPLTQYNTLTMIDRRRGGLERLGGKGGKEKGRYFPAYRERGEKTNNSYKVERIKWNRVGIRKDD